VLVRVLIDDVGARYSWPTAVRKARRAKIPVARFLPVHVPWFLSYSNLRNHRKILVVDGRIGFTGGLNIRAEHCLETAPGQARRGRTIRGRAIRDIHFRIVGPVVAHLQQTFARDWLCTTDERLSGEAWFPVIASAGDALARGIADGPDDDLDKLRMVLLGAIASAKSSISIVTPYFLPDAALIAALNVAAMRGVEVRIVIPAKTNLALVQWASNAQLWQLLERGCRIWLSDPPFDHSKMMVVDEQWSLFGSMNWDPRSLRLNFEFNVECYDAPLACGLGQIIDVTIQASRECTLSDADGRSLFVRLRDGFARVLTPYL
jgi:cardiolipin synthase